MKKLLWLVGVVGAAAAVSVAAAAVMRSKRRELPRPRLALRGMFGFAPQLELLEAEIFEAELVEDEVVEIIEIIPLDVMSGPLAVDEATQAMLAQLADRAMFLK